MQTPPKKSNQLLLIVGLVIGSMAGTFAGSSCWKPPTIEQLLERTAVELNKGLPKMADQETRLDSASTGPNKTLIYHYTLVNLRAADVQKATFVNAMRPKIITLYKTNADMKTLRDNGVTLEYRYLDKSGAPVADFAVSPKDF